MVAKCAQNYLILKSALSVSTHSNLKGKKEKTSYWTFAAVHMQNKKLREMDIVYYI